VEHLEDARGGQSLPVFRPGVPVVPPQLSTSPSATVITWASGLPSGLRGHSGSGWTAGPPSHETASLPAIGGLSSHLSSSSARPDSNDWLVNTGDHAASAARKVASVGAPLSHSSTTG
jgi:hypothetical protein